MRTSRGLLTAAVSSGIGLLATRATGTHPALRRTNYRGASVSLSGGVGAGLAVCAAGAAHTGAAAGAAAAAMAAGLLDDLDNGAHDGEAPAKGLHGHVSALMRGQVTTGVLKIAVIGAGAVLSGYTIARGHSSAAPCRRGASVSRAASHSSSLLVADTAINAVTIAGTANLFNLFDLRPGRAYKAAGLVAAPLMALSRASVSSPGTRLSASLATSSLAIALTGAPSDLRQRTMLGDTGANALGALLGTAVAYQPSRWLRAGTALGVTALIAASERVSFSKVIATTPVLRHLDELGQLPLPGAAPVPSSGSVPASRTGSASAPGSDSTPAPSLASVPTPSSGSSAAVPGSASAPSSDSADAPAATPSSPAPTPDATSSSKA